MTHRETLCARGTNDRNVLELFAEGAMQMRQYDRNVSNQICQSDKLQEVRNMDISKRNTSTICDAS